MKEEMGERQAGETPGLRRPGQEPAQEVPAVDTGRSQRDAGEPAEPLVCAQCGNSNPSDSIFCPKCGAMLLAVEARPAAAGKGKKDVTRGSPKTEILLGGGLLLSAIVTLLGAGSLILALSILAGGLYDNYVVWGFLMLAGPALVLLVPGIIGLVVCIRRVRMQRERILGRRLALSVGAGMFLVLLLAGIAIAWTNRPLKHYKGAPYESPRTTAPTPGPTRMPLAMPTPGGPTPTPWTVAPNAAHPGWTTYTTADGLADDQVNDIAIGPDGAVWFGTSGGVSRYLPPR